MEKLKKRKITVMEKLERFFHRQQKTKPYFFDEKRFFERHSIDESKLTEEELINLYFSV